MSNVVSPGVNCCSRAISEADRETTAQIIANMTSKQWAQFAEQQGQEQRHRINAARHKIQIATFFMGGSALFGTAVAQPAHNELHQNISLGGSSLLLFGAAYEVISWYKERNAANEIRNQMASAQGDQCVTLMKNFERGSSEDIRLIHERAAAIRNEKHASVPTNNNEADPHIASLSEAEEEKKEGSMPIYYYRPYYDHPHFSFQPPVLPPTFDATARFIEIGRVSMSEDNV